MKKNNALDPESKKTTEPQTVIADVAGKRTQGILIQPGKKTIIMQLPNKNRDIIRRHIKKHRVLIF